MAMTTLTVGHIAEPTLRWTQAGKAVLELRVNATRSRKTQDGQWEDDGAQLWASTTFWEDEAQRLADQLGKGDRVTVIGDLVEEEYTTRDGAPAVKHVIRFPRLIEVRPKRDRQQPQQYAPQPAQQPAQGQWGQDQGYPQPQSPTPPF